MITIDVFPDSGHHYTFVPLLSEALQRYPQFKALCQQGRQPWREVNYSWIRARFAMKDGQPGLWVAVESNVGTVKRGSIFEPTQVCDSPGDISNPTPYAASDVSKLPNEAKIITLRVPLLMGDSPGGKRSLHERLLADWAAGKTPRLYTDEFRQPCTAENLAEVLVELCERRDVLGLAHWAGTELLSRYALGVKLRERFKLSEKQAPLAAVTRDKNLGKFGARVFQLGVVACIAGIVAYQIQPKSVPFQIAFGISVSVSGTPIAA